MMSPPDQYDGRSVSQFLIIDDLTSPQAWACQRKLISHYTLRLCLLYILTGSFDDWPVGTVVNLFLNLSLRPRRLRTHLRLH